MFFPKFAIRQTRWEMKDGVVLEDARNMLPSIGCWFILASMQSWLPLIAINLMGYPTISGQRS